MQKILKKQAHLNKVLKAVLNTNQLIGKESDPVCLIQKACEELIGTMGYFNAWIGLLDEEGRHVKLTGTAGFDRAFDVMRERLHQGVFPCCMQHTLQTNDLVVIRDPLAECSDCPLSKEYAGRASLSCRLAHKGRLFGILSVSVPGGFSHEKDEHDLVLEVAGDLAFALAKIDAEKNGLEKRLKQAQKMEAIGTIAGGIAHDFNNILFPIIGMSELLMEDLSKDSIQYENAREILTAEKRGADLVNQISEMAETIRKVLDDVIG